MQYSLVFICMYVMRTRRRYDSTRLRAFLAFQICFFLRQDVFSSGSQFKQSRLTAWEQAGYVKASRAVNSLGHVCRLYGSQQNVNKS